MTRPHHEEVEGQGPRGFRMEPHGTRGGGKKYTSYTPHEEVADDTCKAPEKQQNEVNR